MTEPPVGIGLLGSGRIGRMHAQMLCTRVNGACLVAVQDEVAEVARQVGADLGVPTVDSADEMLADPAVDAVAICTSTDAHIPLLIAAVQAGKSVFCEKPLALDLAEIDRAIAVASAAATIGVSGAAGVTGAAAPTVQIGFNRRFDPSHEHLVARVRAGDIGEVHLVRITSRDPEPPPLEYVLRSGGIFVDMTIHDFDMARFVTASEVVEVYATGAARIDPRVGELGDLDTAVSVLVHENGAVTTIDNSRQAVYGYDQRVEAFGSAGMLVSENIPSHVVTRRDSTGGHTAGLPNFFIERYEASYIAQWEAFVETARGAPSPVTLADGRAPVAIAQAATLSVAQGRPVALTEIG